MWEIYNMKNSQKDTLLLTILGIAVIIGIVVLWNMNHTQVSGYRAGYSPVSGNNQNPNNFGPWKSGDTPQECQGNYDLCMEKCNMFPSIGCPGQCLEEKEYCQEYSS